jgi:sugar phosphate isomerase/epimerase
VTDEREGARRLIETVDADNCGLNWQPLFRFSAETLLEEAAALAPLANNVHLQGVAEPGETDRCALEDVYFDVEAILEAFQAADFDGFANVEFVTSDGSYEAAIESDLRFLGQVV